jgi:hypothetical protein
MEFPKYLLGDNSDYPSAVFVIHTVFPRFIINLENDEVEWLEDFDSQDQEELESETENLIREASAFYDREIERYEDD